MKLVQSILTKNPCYTAGRKITVKGADAPFCGLSAAEGICVYQ